MAQLLLGPLLRYVGATSATVWVETDRPCEVRVLDATTHTFAVHGHHYALVDVTGLAPGSVTPYEVALDGEQVWPAPGAPYPPSRIRTVDPVGPLRLVFGSCRVAPAAVATHGVDALSAYAHRLAEGQSERPDLLLMLGDQVYADDPAEEVRDLIRRRRDVGEPPHEEVADFEEYTLLYRLAWSADPAVRWLLSTVPSFMIFDDHDIRDDWNTSYAWRQEMASRPWWRHRIVGGLGSYWVYQHLGNLSSEERAADPVFKAVRAAARDGGDGGTVLDDHAERADREPAAARWSFSHDLGRTRLIVLDSRCGRVLEAGRRAMLDDTELAWFDERCRGDVDHLLIASSLPYLLPSTIHHAEAWNEALCEGAWGRLGARFGERLRQGADLEHWAAFDGSFRAVAHGLLSTARGERGQPPASIAMLSGDVHYSYLARVAGTPISQVVCSPIRNPLSGHFRWANIVACVRATELPTRLMRRLARVPRLPLRWRLSAGPWFKNSVATVEIDGRTALVRWETPTSATTLTELASAPLT